MIKKGIVLSGGIGSRLYPLTLSICKQLLPVYDKPMIYYPISVLMIANIRDILVICTPNDIEIMQRVLGEGSKFGIKLSYAIQPQANGIAECFIIAEDFIGKDNVCLILGDNIFFGSELEDHLHRAKQFEGGGVIFGYKVHNPEHYGVIRFDENGSVKEVIEKPKNYVSNYAVTGLYFYDNTVIQKAKTLTPSDRGELEITDIQNLYLQEQRLKVHTLPLGTAWLDAGTYEGLMETSHYVQVLQKRQGIKIACLEEIALRKNWITTQELYASLPEYHNNEYVQYLKNLGITHEKN